MPDVGDDLGVERLVVDRLGGITEVDEGTRALPLELIVDADDRGLRDRGARGDDGPSSPRSRGGARRRCGSAEGIGDNLT